VEKGNKILYVIMDGGGGGNILRNNGLALEKRACSAETPRRGSLCVVKDAVVLLSLSTFIFWILKSLVEYTYIERSTALVP
jgi:hypothetical protein